MNKLKKLMGCDIIEKLLYLLNMLEFDLNMCVYKRKFVFKLKSLS